MLAPDLHSQNYPLLSLKSFQYIPRVVACSHNAPQFLDHLPFKDPVIYCFLPLAI